MTNKEILALEYKLIDGIKTSDVLLLDQLLHEDLLFIAPNGKTITKQMDLASHAARQMKVESLTPNFEEIRLIGDTAVVTVVYDTRGKMMGNPIQGQFRYLRVWKKFPDGFKVIGGSCMQV